MSSATGISRVTISKGQAEHQTLEEGSEFDSWHQTREQALKEAERLWGVMPSAWRADLRAV